MVSAVIWRQHPSLEADYMNQAMHSRIMSGVGRIDTVMKHSHEKALIRFSLAEFGGP